MYGYTYPLVIYGWREEGDRNQVIDECWLAKYYKNGEDSEEDFESIAVYANGMSKNHGMMPVYGVVCMWDPESGQAMVPDLTTKKKVDALFGRIFKNKDDNPNQCELGFYLAITGDYDTCWDEYEPELDE
jgi:hypothetical protein